MNQKTILWAMTRLKVCFPALQINRGKEAISVWQEALQDLSEELFKNIINDICLNAFTINPEINLVALIKHTAWRKFGKGFSEANLYPPGWNIN